MLAFQSLPSTSARLKTTASRIYSRMEFLGLNETRLSEQCSLAAIRMREDQDVPGLTRDRLSKILMNRHDVPAKSAARVITHAELAVVAEVLKVSIEWLEGQADNRDPVVWNVLAEPNRCTELANLLKAYEKLGNETTVWSRYPMPGLTSEAFGHAFCHLHFGRKSGTPNAKPLVEFYNKIFQLRRKWILGPDRSSKYTSLIYRSHFEYATCGEGIFSPISKTILARSLSVMIEVITEPTVKVELVILDDESATALEALRDYEILESVDNSFSAWRYYNGHVGWSENPSYANSHHQLLARTIKHRLFGDVNETVDYLKSLQTRLCRGPK